MLLRSKLIRLAPRLFRRQDIEWFKTITKYVLYAALFLSESLTDRMFVTGCPSYSRVYSAGKMRSSPPRTASPESCYPTTEDVSSYASLLVADYNHPSAADSALSLIGLCSLGNRDPRRDHG